MRSSRKLLKQARRAILVALMLSAGTNVLLLVTPLYTLQLFDTVVPTGSIETLAVLTLMVAVAILALAVIELCRDRIMIRAGLWLDHVLGQHMLENGLKAGQSPADMRADAAALRQVRTLITSPTASQLLDAPWAPAFLVLLALLHPWLGAVGAAAGMLLLVIAWLQATVTARPQTESAQALDAAERWLGTVSANSGLTGALGLTPGATEQWSKFNGAHITASYAVAKRTSFTRTLARVVRIAAQIALYGTGALLIIRNELAPGALVASAILLARGIGPLESLVGALRVASAARQGYARLKALAPDVESPRVDGSGDMPPGYLSLHDATVVHPGRRGASLRNVTLSLAPGESLGIVGPNGAGKSTLAATIAGVIMPVSGAAELDGVPIGRWQRTAGEPPIGYLPDDPALIEGTVHQNICRFRADSLMSVAQSAMRAGVHEIIAAMPAGYDTPVGAGGSGLAMRERRAVALARAVHKSPRLIVLDEPELGLDGQSLRKLIRTLEALKGAGIGIVVATQDPRLLGMMDRIVVLNGGAVQAAGPAQEISAQFAVRRQMQSEARVH